MSGGKSNTSTQSVAVPAEVLARYGAVNDQAQQTAAKPFQSYGSDPSAFVAQLNDTQNQGIAGTNAAANMAQPYYALAGQDITKGQSQADPLNAQAGQGFTSALAGAQPYNQGATGLALAGAQAVNPTNLDASSIQKYISPYLNTVLGSTSALLNQNNQQQQAGQLGNAITSGAFGGDRAGIAAANLAQQQNLGNASIYSGILNDAYGQALTTAQNQQSLGLGAAQANRAALSGAAGQIQGIGQQSYEQGTGTAAAQQGLGQQVFNQGLAASGAQQGLGSAAQSSALQGAQAQLAAGQLQQQTEQAGKTALYNQFLQQQSYPFQVSQFLANIAEGTGSLSGSTTTTTQPGSLFSDRRVKDDIRKVGKTFDGQTIYTFKYKGDDTTHIGLMAQDVEKKHPDAVGLSSGIKTVNYEKATDDAAERGKFKRGGLALVHEYADGGSTGFDPETTQRLLMTAQGMYGGLGAGGTGVYGGAAGRVPTANLPVGELKTAGALPQQPSGLAQASQIANLAGSAANGYDWLKEKTGKNDNEPPPTTLLPEESKDGVPEFYQHGGLVKRYADGGMPYSDGLDIPDEHPQYKLPTAGPLSKSNSTIDDLKAAANISQTAAMFMNRGGLAGYADGGSPDFDMFDPNFYGDRAKAPSVTAAQMRAFTGGNNNAPNFDETGLSYGVHMPDIGSPNFDETGSTFRDATAPATKDDSTGLAHTHMLGTHGDPDPTLGLTAAVHRPRQTATGLVPLDATTTSDITSGPPLPINTPNGPNIGAPDPAALNLNTQGPDAAQFAKRSPLADIGDNAGNVINGITSRLADKNGYIGKLMRGDPKTLIPFLAGLGAFTAAPTRNFGTALAQGLSAGAQTYPKLQQMELERAKTAAGIEQTKATTGQIGANTTKAQQENSVSFYKLQQAGLLRPDPNGLIIDPATGTKYSNTQAGTSVSGIPGGAPTPTYKYLGKSAQDVLQKSAHQFVMDSPGMGINPNPGNIATSNKIIADTYQTSQDAKTAKNIQNEQAAAILSQSRNGVLSQGALAPIFQPYVEKFNSLVTDNGHPELAIQGLGDAQIAHKLQLGQAAMQTTGAGQHAYQALSDFTQLAPGVSLDPKAAATLMAQNAVSATRAIDQQNALDEAKKYAPNGNYEAQDILSAFNQDSPPAVYNAMRDAVAEIYQKPDEYSKIHAALAHPGSPQYKTIVNTLNAYGKARGVPNLAHVFTGE